MSTAQHRMTQGLCPDCPDGKLHHGPWTAEQIREVADDIGMLAEDFADTCDDCFVDQVGLGDVAYSQSLCSDHTLVLQRQHGPLSLLEAALAHVAGHNDFKQAAEVHP